MHVACTARSAQVSGSVERRSRVDDREVGAVARPLASAVVGVDLPRRVGRDGGERLMRGGSLGCTRLGAVGLEPVKHGGPRAAERLHLGDEGVAARGRSQTGPARGAGPADSLVAAGMAASAAPKDPTVRLGGVRAATRNPVRMQRRGSAFTNGRNPDADAALAWTGFATTGPAAGRHTLVIDPTVGR